MAKHSLMLVDDNPTFRRIIEDFIDKQARFARMEWAQNGKQAIDLARQKEPEVVLLDLGMPDISGLEVLPILRSILPGAIIVVVTLMDSDSYRQAAVQAGADGFVAKSRLNADLMPTLDGLIEANVQAQSVA